MRGKVSVKGMLFYGFHGTMEVERELGQKFLVDVELYMDLEKATEKDDPALSVSPQKIYEIAGKFVTTHKYYLTETLAVKIAKEFLERFDFVEEALVRVRRPQLLVSGIVDYAEAEVSLRREEM